MNATPISRELGRYRGNSVFEALVPVECHDCRRQILPGEKFIRIPISGRGIHTHVVCSRCEHFIVPPQRTHERRPVWGHSNIRNHKQHHLYYQKRHHRRPRR